ncbi:MAG: DNA sulfur modification protein DndE [Deltaproteobacteria bacterium]|jgi:DNA sulfur modification protein DndE|nr:DNA sulfur modification protein DndE [Deltaproteobacteria bacterium]
MIPVSTIRLSVTAREQLITLKRHTGIRQWNVLCRWAFTTSLAELSMPPRQVHPADSNVEMTWKVFGGTHEAVYAALLVERCIADGLPVTEEILAEQFRLHLHRGIAYLVGDRSLRSIEALMQKGLHAG